MSVCVFYVIFCLLFTRRQLSVITQREIAYTVRKSRICCCKISFHFFYLYLLVIIYCFQVIPSLTLSPSRLPPISRSVLSALCYFSCRCLAFFFSRHFLFRFICTISSWSFHISSFLLILLFCCCCFFSFLLACFLNTSLGPHLHVFYRFLA